MLKHANNPWICRITKDLSAAMHPAKEALPIRTGPNPQHVYCRPLPSVVGSTQGQRVLCQPARPPLLIHKRCAFLLNGSLVVLNSSLKRSRSQGTQATENNGLLHQACHLWRCCPLVDKALNQLIELVHSAVIERFELMFDKLLFAVGIEEPANDIPVQRVN